MNQFLIFGMGTMQEREEASDLSNLLQWDGVDPLPLILFIKIKKKSYFEVRFFLFAGPISSFSLKEINISSAIREVFCYRKTYTKRDMYPVTLIKE